MLIYCTLSSRGDNPQSGNFYLALNLLQEEQTMINALMISVATILVVISITVPLVMFTGLMQSIRHKEK